MTRVPKVMFYILYLRLGCGWPISRLRLHGHIWQYTGAGKLGQTQPGFSNQVRGQLEAGECSQVEPV